MSTPSRALLLAATVAAGAALAQVKIALPDDSPVTLVSADWGGTTTSERGGALVVDLHSVMSLRNSSARRIRGLTLVVASQEVTPGGRASVTKVSLDVGSGENFPVRIDLRLLRPLQKGTGPLVEVTLDGVLFDDLSFYGPNRVESRRALTAWEMEAQRDRQWFRQVLEREGAAGLRRECVASLARQAETQVLDVQLARGERVTASPMRKVEVAALRLPDAPVQAVGGAAMAAEGLAAVSSVDLVNQSARAVRSVEIGWMLRDTRGREYSAGATPVHIEANPGARFQAKQEGRLKFTESGGAPVSIGSLTAFVSQVEFADGSLWVPARIALNDAVLRKAMAPSGEEQRLTSIYRKRGLPALMEELRRF